MRNRTEFCRSLCHVLVAVGVVLTQGLVFGAASDAGANSALANWQVALSAFRRAGNLVADGKYPEVRISLNAAATNLPAPYRRMAGQFLSGLDEALTVPVGAARSERLGDLCSEWGAWDAAARLRSVPSSNEDEVDDPLRAWRLFEIGKLEAAVAEYERKLAEERISTFKDYYKKQIDLLKRRSSNQANAQYSLEWIREHYLKSYEGKADYFGALSEVARVLPQVKDSKEILELHRMAIQCLTSLGDLQGRDAWEDKTLRDLKADPEACAEVYLQRGVRAYAEKRYDSAAALFRKVCQEFTGTLAYGDALYDLGTVLQDQAKFEEAIAEFERLISSNVNDQRLTPGTSEDYRNYRHKAALRISECYEAKKEYGQALQYAELAANQYKPLSWCSTCLNSARSALERRIKLLQEQASKSN